MGEYKFVEEVPVLAWEVGKIGWRSGKGRGRGREGGREREN